MRFMRLDHGVWGFCCSPAEPDPVDLSTVCSHATLACGSISTCPFWRGASTTSIHGLVVTMRMAWDTLVRYTTVTVTVLLCLECRIATCIAISTPICSKQVSVGAIARRLGMVAMENCACPRGAGTAQPDDSSRRGGWLGVVRRGHSSGPGCCQCCQSTSYVRRTTTCYPGAVGFWGLHG